MAGRRCHWVVDPEFAGQVLLAEGDDAHLIARTEGVGGNIRWRQQWQVASRPTAADKRQPSHDPMTTEQA